MREDMEQQGSNEVLSEDWQIVQDLLPKGWEDQARALGATRRRGRGISDAGTLLRVLLIHLAQGCGLRETAVRAREGGLADVTDVAILKRLRGCGEWFKWMAEGLCQRWLSDFPDAESLFRGRRVRLVDGTMVSEPGETGSEWRLHYSVRLPGLRCDEVIVTSPREGETLKRFAVAESDVLIGDRGFANAAGIAHVVAHKGDVIVRTNLVTLPLFDADGQRIDILPLLERLKVGRCGQWPVSVHAGKQRIAGRLCALKKSAAAANKARARVARESQRGGHQVRPETLAAAGYVFVFTSLPDSVPAATILELYRGRWQIELVFKRLKSLVQLGHLKKHDEQAARAWLQGKLLVAFLIDALLESAERFSPWGYRSAIDNA